MNLYLGRHADALAGDDDRTRPLSDIGRAQCQQVSLFLGTAGVVVNDIRHSGYLRTQDTAEAYARSMSDTLRLEPDERLEPEAPIEPVLALIESTADDLLFVGHYPQLMRLSAHLLGCAAVSFAPGSIACLAPAGATWTVQWFLDPRLLGRADLLAR